MHKQEIKNTHCTNMIALSIITDLLILEKYKYLEKKRNIILEL